MAALKAKQCYCNAAPTTPGTHECEPRCYTTTRLLPSTIEWELLPLIKSGAPFGSSLATVRPLGQLVIIQCLIVLSVVQWNFTNEESMTNDQGEEFKNLAHNQLALAHLGFTDRVLLHRVLFCVNISCIFNFCAIFVAEDDIWVSCELKCPWKH